LRDEEHTILQEISRRTRQEVFGIARKTLSDLAATSLEARMVDIFVRRLRELDDEEKIGLGEALKTASDPALVRSAFDLPAEHCTEIQNALNEIFSAEIHLRFETAPDVISGIELTTNGQKVSWSISEYLASLEQAVDELLQEKEKPEDKVKAPPQEIEPEINIADEQGN
jgi:F-type H+-transporting ATPase subunit b